MKNTQSPLDENGPSELPEALDLADDDIEEIEEADVAEATNSSEGESPHAAADAAPEADADIEDVVELDADDIELEPPSAEAESAAPQAASVSSLDDLLNEAIGAAENISITEDTIVVSDGLGKEIDAYVRGLRTLTPGSGAKTPDEWLGHVLLGYAPFNVSIKDRGASGEIDFSPLRSMSKEI